MDAPSINTPVVVILKAHVVATAESLINTKLTPLPDTGVVVISPKELTATDQTCEEESTRFILGFYLIMHGPFPQFMVVGGLTRSEYLMFAVEEVTGPVRPLNEVTPVPPPITCQPAPPLIAKLNGPPVGPNTQKPVTGVVAVPQPAIVAGGVAATRITACANKDESESRKATKRVFIVISPHLRI